MNNLQPTVSAYTRAGLQSVFQFFDANGDGRVSPADLAKALNESLHKNLSDRDVLALLLDVSSDGRADEGDAGFDVVDFITYVLSKRADGVQQLKEAFTLLDKDKDGKITRNDLSDAMDALGWNSDVKDLEETFLELDLDGDGALDLADFSRPITEFYAPKKLLATVADAVVTAPTVTPQPMSAAKDTTHEAPSGEKQPAAENELAHVRALLARHPRDVPEHGSSTLQLQIGLFRLIQGAAYRCFRTSFSANHETHLPVRDLPYRISDLVPFVRAAIELYKGLGIVSMECHSVLDAVPTSLEAEYGRLLARVKNWNSVEKTPAMLAEAQQMSNSSRSAVTNRARFVMFVEKVLGKHKPVLEFIDIVNEVLAAEEMQRLRLLESLEFGPAVTPESTGAPRDYLARWNRVILEHASESVPGAMMPVVYWYEDFMPKLLAAFSVASASDIEGNTNADEVALMQWYEEASTAGEFLRHGPYIPLVFPAAIPTEKLRIKQAWRLARHYLNGVQKRRERLEFGRESGALSQYVAFIDVYLGRTFIRDADMRLSFPYYIGPAVWRFLHTTAEITATRSTEEQLVLVERFKEFFRLFAFLYPCPYCRHHLNAYVVQNREIDMYPLEYILLGHEPSSTELKMSLGDKLATVTDGSSLRFFLWKLHNTVSSSISRSEEWYQHDERAFYTTRFWPSIDAEIDRARVREQVSVSTGRIAALYELWKPLSRLSYIRAQMQAYITTRDPARLHGALGAAQEHIVTLEGAVMQGGFLQEIYRFDAQRTDQDPSFTPEEEAYSRSATFVAI